MNINNENRIIAACPSLFRNINEEYEKMIKGEFFTPMAFMFECADGWTDLLIELCEKIQAHLNTLPKNVADEIVAIQVKEKFGTLRFYVSVYEETIQSYIKEAEKKSCITCETCGCEGKLRGAVWYYTACDLHTETKDLQEEQNRT